MRSRRWASSATTSWRHSSTRSGSGTSEGQPLSGGISYSLVEIARYHEFVGRLGEAFEGLGIELTAVHTEAGPGLLELNLAAGRGLEAADSAALVKFAVKEVAASLDMRASFLAKTAPGEEGSSGHVHISCWSDEAECLCPGRAGRRAASGLHVGRGRDARAPRRLLAPPQSDHQLVQTARAGLVRPGEQELGRGEPLRSGARDRLVEAGALPDRVPPPRGRREPLPGRSPHSWSRPRTAFAAT